MIFETHAHYDDAAFDQDRESIFARLPEMGVGRVVNIASNLDSIGKCLDLAEAHPFMYCALGIHPSDCGPLTEALLEDIRARLRRPRVVAVGEIGLDYYWDTPDRPIQKRWFEAQLEMAHGEGLPVVIHSREAARDTMDILRAHKAGDLGGVIHCYSYSLEMAREFVEMGFFIGVGGVVTFKNAKKLKEVVAGISIDHLVLETDSPYLAPAPFRGKRNSSLYLPYVVDAVAQIKGMDPQEVIDRTERNAERLYGL